MLTLRLAHRGEGGAQLVEITLDGDGIARRATSRLSVRLDPEGRERLRWYLEDFLEAPLGPAPALAAGVEAEVGALGTSLFSEVFSGEAAELWSAVSPRLAETRVEVTAEPTAAPLPWELIRNSSTDAPLALGAASFVRTEDRTGPRPAPPARRDTLRVLLVVDRPGGPGEGGEGGDLPFRSVARHLVRLGATVGGLDVDVLRPPTRAALAQAVQGAQRSGRPYQVVHFEGQGESRTVDKVDGPALGQILADAEVPVVVLHACRSAHAEAPTVPEQDRSAADVLGGRVEGIEARARDLAGAGIPGVVALPFSVCETTAGRFVTDLYGAVLGGQALGEAVARCRRALAADPVRSIGYDPRPLQDWVVPVVYESAPLALIGPADPSRPATGAEAATADRSGPAGIERLPVASELGFFGRDETVLALDGALLDHAAVVLWAPAGAGKTSAAAEFARWYALTGGADAVLWTSFERPVTLARLLDQVADAFAPVLGANKVRWAALPESERRTVALGLLGRVPLLWVWDDAGGGAGLPSETGSEPSGPEWVELRDFLADLGATPAKVLLTSADPETEWLGDLAARVELPPLPMRERAQLAQAVAARRGRRLPDAEDWRPLLRASEGHPLAVVLLASQALSQDLHGGADLDGFVDRLRAGPTPGQVADGHGRAAVLGASLRAVLQGAFDATDQARLGLVGLFRELVTVTALLTMGDPAAPRSLTSLGGPTRQDWVDLLDRAADAGLVSSTGRGAYRLHPAVASFLAGLLAERSQAWGPEPGDGMDAAARAYVRAMAEVGELHHRVYFAGNNRAVAILDPEEANLLHARSLALAGGWWEELMGTMQGLRVIHDRGRRTCEWARLIAEVTHLYVDPATEGPLAGRQEQWSVLTAYRVQLARAQRDWPGAERLLRALIASLREQAADALAAPPGELSADQRHRLRSLGASVHDLGEIRREQGRPDCADRYLEAVDLAIRAGDRQGEATAAYSLGTAHKDLPELQDVDQAERWYRRSLDLLDEDDRLARAAGVGQLGYVILQRFSEERQAGAPAELLERRLDAAAELYEEALGLFPPDAVAQRAVIHNQLGNVYEQTGDLVKAVGHYHQAIRDMEATGNRFGGGQVRFNVARLLARDGRNADALRYARSALTEFELYGSRAEQIAGLVRSLIAGLEAG